MSKLRQGFIDVMWWVLLLPDSQCQFLCQSPCILHKVPAKKQMSKKIAGSGSWCRWGSNPRLLPPGGNVIPVPLISTTVYVNLQIFHCMSICKSFMVYCRVPFCAELHVHTEKPDLHVRTGCPHSSRMFNTVSPSECSTLSLPENVQHSLCSVTKRTECSNN